MGKIDFIELANICVNRQKDLLDQNVARYLGTLYVAILPTNKALCSKLPQILDKAVKCILIHERKEKAVTNWHLWYKIDYINEEGCVSDGNLGDGFNLSINPTGSFLNQILSLETKGYTVYRCNKPWEDHIGKIWNIYSKLKEIKTEKEKGLAIELFWKDEKILELEKENTNFKFANQLLKQERDMYKELLDEIKHLLKNRG